MTKKYICRKCNTHLSYDAKRSKNICTACSQNMELLINPVNIFIKSIKDPSQLDLLKKYILKVFMLFKIPKSTANIFDSFPVSILDNVNLKDGIKEALQLQNKGAEVSVISSISGEILSEVEIKQLLANSPTPGSNSNGEADKLQILVVEDNGIQRKYICKAIQDIKNTSINEAEHGIAAIAHMAKQHFDIIITDITMPHMDGIKLMQYIRSNKASAEVPIIVLTARATQSDVSKALSFKVEGYILKPVKPEKVIEKVEAVIKSINNKTTIAKTG